MPDNVDHTANRIYSVSKLTSDIKSLLESRFPFVWVRGEISNFSVPVSGHFYFTLKDEHAQIGAVMFRGQNRQLKFRPESGMRVVGLGRISVYEPRGAYQIIFELLEPEGIGAFQVAFEQLKARLAEEGLFDEKHKRPIPFLPFKISVITSATGSVIHDIRHVVRRRFESIPLEILPVKVQGDDAIAEIVAALELINTRGDSDVIILARGGGSIEDLAPFNSEAVARAIFASRIPVVSAIGHETDFTIADFTADLRAPTPSAAAELVVPVKNDLIKQVVNTRSLLIAAMLRRLANERQQLERSARHLIDPRRTLEDYRLRIDEFTGRLARNVAQQMRFRREQMRMWRDRLWANSPDTRVRLSKEKLEVIFNNLSNQYIIYFNQNMHHFKQLDARLQNLNPTAILNRGYSITRRISNAAIVKQAAAVELGEELEILLAKGSLNCQVKGIRPDGKKNI